MAEVNINDEFSVRHHKLQELEAAGYPGYPAHSERTHTVAEALAATEGTTVTIAGRMYTKRDMGKIAFAHVQDASGRMQVALKKEAIDETLFSVFAKKIDSGDIVQFTGERFVTQKGEQSILVTSWKLLAKSLLPLPEKWHGLSDVETRYRQRYLDLVSNPEAMRIALMRSNLVKALRNYFDGLGFYEVETPVLQTLYGGALAKPFVTHHNALDIPLYLRIAPELYLKRLIVGGFEKVYEIAKCFRNEGIDHNHNPEFTQIEFYWAYADYQMLMDLMEDLMPKLITAAGLPLKFATNGQEVDFTPPYARISMRDLIKQYAKIDIEDYPDKASLLKKALEMGVEVDDTLDRGTLVDEVYKKFARPYIINPIFVIDHPVELSPLAKRKPDAPAYVERFQLLCVGGNELCNAFTELNDPIDQEARFKEQVENREAGNEESMPYDEDFVTALKHGMPPTGGLGMGIDRLIKLLADAQNLKEVILFPTLKPAGEANDVGKAKQTLVAHAVLLDTPEVPSWSKLNAAAHLSAALAAREGKKLIHLENSQTADGEVIPMNIQHAIMMKSTANRADLLALKHAAETAGLIVTCFTEDMRDSSNDIKVKAKQETKKAADIGFLGVLVFGEKKTVEKLTEQFPLAG